MKNVKINLKNLLLGLKIKKIQDVKVVQIENLHLLIVKAILSYIKFGTGLSKDVLTRSCKKEKSPFKSVVSS